MGKFYQFKKVYLIRYEKIKQKKYREIIPFQPLTERKN